MIPRAATPLAILLTVLSVAKALAEDCVCKEAILRGGWCKSCSVGYVAGVRIESADLFEALDAHGHEIQIERIACASCGEAFKSDGYCDRCEMGFVKGQAYLSRLTYELALGEVTKLADIPCQTCQEFAGKHGWCETCQRGWIGFVSIRNRDHYDRAAKAYAILVDAVKTLPRCRICAVAMVTNARCLACKISYRDGKPIESHAEARE